MSETDPSSKRKVNHLARRDPEVQARISQILPPERYKHQLGRNAVLAVLEPRVNNALQLNKEFYPLIETEPIPKYGNRDRRFFFERFEQISAVIADSQSASGVIALTSPGILATIMGIAPHSLLLPEDAYHILQFTKLGTADDFVFTGTTEKSGAIGLGQTPGIEVNREGYVLMRPYSVARRQGVTGSFPDQSGYRFKEPGQRSVATDMFIPGATKLTPIPPDFFRFFVPDPNASVQANQKFAERNIASELQSHVSNEIFALDKMFGLLEYLQTIREGFLRIQFLDALISERGYNWIHEPKEPNPSTESFT